MKKLNKGEHRVGMRVKISSDSEFYHGLYKNPVGVMGTITNISFNVEDVAATSFYDCAIDVKWDNNETNIYRPIDLLCGDGYNGDGIKFRFIRC